MTHIFVLPLLAALQAVAPLTASPAQNAAKDIIWSLEQGIYRDQERGSSAAYIAAASPRYLGWPPTAPRPLTNQNLRVGGVRPTIAALPQIRLSFVDIAFSGNTAIIYYQTVRTRVVEGKELVDGFDVTHTWLKENGTWRLLGGMARPRVGPPL